MMKTCLTALLLFLTINLQAQIELLRFNAIRLCDSIPVIDDKVRPTLHSSTEYKDSIELKIRVYENCGLNSKQGAFNLKNDTLNLMWTENNDSIDKENVVYENGTWFDSKKNIYHTTTSCDCYLELTYTIKGIDEIAHLLIDDKKVFQKDSMYRIFEPSFTIYKGDTINYTDSIGIKIGKWIEFDSIGRVIKVIEDRYEESYTSYEYFEYYENGEMSLHFFSKRTKNGFDLEEKYSENGILSERYFSSLLYLENQDSFEITYREYFNEKGELLKRELTDVRNNLYEYGYLYE